MITCSILHTPLAVRAKHVNENAEKILEHSGEMRRDTERYRDVQRDTRRYRRIPRDTERYRCRFREKRYTDVQRHKILTESQYNPIRI